jgi:diguanylate cyclase (GGDEF)-like protein
MDWNTLPDLLALTALVAVFSSLLPRKADSSLRLWLAGWILIVIHFAAKFSDASGNNVVSSMITLGTLDLAGLAFMWAAVARTITLRGSIVVISLAVPQLAFIALGVFSVASLDAYAVTIFLGFAIPAFVLMRAVPKASDRILAILACAVLGGSLLVVARFDSDPSDGVNNILTWLYLGAAILHWRRFGKPTAGALTVVFGFIAWGLVFPIGCALDAWLPHLHIDDTAYNIPKYIVAIGVILTLLEEQMERSVFLAKHDELTGLPNRRMLEERLDAAIERGRRNGLKFALFTIDLDRFKTINDSFGHSAGDGFLCDVAERFASRMRKIDTCARYGGDEFIVVADQLQTRGDAECIARDLMETLAEPIKVRGENVHAEASIGIALFPDDGQDAETLYAISDAAMYASKHMHRRRELLTAENRAAG